MRRHVVSGFLALWVVAPAWAEPPIELIRVPPGFKAELYAEVPGARSMAVVDALGVVFVGTRGNAVYAVHTQGPAPRRVEKVLAGLKVPNGLDWRDGYLYIAEQHRLVRYRANDLSALKAAKPEVLFDRLPDHSHHGWRYVRFGPDGYLYVAIGAACNICTLEGLQGTIVRFRVAGGAPEVYATGIRNSVGFDFQPTTGELYFTDNGADFMGDDSPPDELNHAPKPGLDFGFPYFGGGEDRTPDYKDAPRPVGLVPPVVKFGAHVAALGISFYRGAMFPPEYRGDAFVAQRGSWNRSVPDGYRVARVRFDAQGRARSWETFADGWLGKDGRYWGRVVDVKELQNGSLLVSDNHQGAIYRIFYKSP